jgi:hypothetical protein
MHKICELENQGSWTASRRNVARLGTDNDRHLAEMPPVIDGIKKLRRTLDEFHGCITAKPAHAVWEKEERERFAVTCAQ